MWREIQGGLQTISGSLQTVLHGSLEQAPISKFEELGQNGGKITGLSSALQEYWGSQEVTEKLGGGGGKCSRNTRKIV